MNMCCAEFRPLPRTYQRVYLASGQDTCALIVSQCNERGFSTRGTVLYTVLPGG